MCAANDAGDEVEDNGYGGGDGEVVPISGSPVLGDWVLMWGASATRTTRLRLTATTTLVLVLVTDVVVKSVVGRCCDS
jgi:hypothetical protein